MIRTMVPEYWRKVVWFPVSLAAGAKCDKKNYAKRGENGIIIVVAAETERSSHKVYEKDKIGEVQIADEVVAIIAGLAATEVDGVDSMAGNITNELVGKLGMKNLSKGVKVEVTEEHVSVNMALNLKYGYSIPDVCEKVQEKVKNAIENMTGLTVLDVNIKIAGVSLEEK